MRKLVFGVVLAFLATALAGCVGDFEVKQTEPLRIQIDGEGEDSRLACNTCDGGGGMDGATRSEKSEFRIDTAGDDVDQVKVVVQVKNVVVQSDGDDDDGGEPTMTTGNATTGNETEDDATDEVCVILVIVEDRNTGEKLAEERVETADSSNVELNVNVKGKDNVVVVTQAVEGVADVNVAAQAGGSINGGGMDDGEEPTSTTSTMTTSTTSEPTNTTATSRP